MIDPQRAQLLQDKLKDVLISKKEEFHLLGYDAVTEDEVWACVTSKYKQNWPMFHQIVNDIYTLKPVTFMNWLTMNAYQSKIDIRKNGLL